MCPLAPEPGLLTAQPQVQGLFYFSCRSWPLDRVQHLLPMSGALSTDIFPKTTDLERSRPLLPLSPKG